MDTFTNIPRNRIITNRIRTILVGYFFGCFYSYSSHPVQFPSHSRPIRVQPQPQIPCFIRVVIFRRSDHPIPRPIVPTPVVRLPPRKGCTEACMSPARTCKNILLDNSSKRTIRRSRNALASILPVGSSTAASATSSSSGLRASSCLAGATTRAERPLHCAPMRATTVAALMGGAPQKTGAAGCSR